MGTRAATVGQLDGWTVLARLVEADGSAGQPHRRKLLGGPPSLRDLADLLHALCAVHGRQPGMADAALDHAAQPDAAEWLTAVAEGFLAERGYLAQLVAAAGPLPSTPGQAETEAALVGQRHALDMLARSDRAGCATGAVAALVLDWPAIRAVLDVAADRFGVARQPFHLPIDGVDALFAGGPGPARAMRFGADQMLAQMRGLWHLLEARAAARG
jgi:hypothetical protein